MGEKAVVEARSQEGHGGDSKPWGLRDVLWSATCRLETQASQGVSLSLNHNLQAGKD